MDDGEIDPASNGGAGLPATERDWIKLARADLWVFIELTFGVLHPGQRLVGAQYLELLTYVLMKVERAELRRLIINMPPRHMKSMLTSIMYVAWRLGRDPTAKFICISYGDDLAHNLSTMTRKLMTSREYAKIFPNTVLEKKSVDHIVTTKGGGRYATAVGSDITGFGATEIIIDDPMEPEQAASETAKEKVRSWIFSSVMTRFNDPSKGALILVMHRLAPDDLSATLGASGNYYTLKLPLVAEKPEYYTDDDGKVLMERLVGEVLNPDRMTLADVEEYKAGLSSHAFNSQCQQRPTAGGSGMLSLEQFSRYERGREPRFELIMHSWDVGATITGNASVCTKWGVSQDRALGAIFYLLDVVKIKVELPQVRAAIQAQDAVDRPAFIVIDERGVGLGVYQQLRADGYRHVYGTGTPKDPVNLENSEIRPSASKIERFGRAALLIGDGRVFIPTEADWLESFLYEVLAFPNISDKDQVDSMTQLLCNWKNCLMFARQRHRPEHLDRSATGQTARREEPRRDIARRRGPNYWERNGY